MVHDGLARLFQPGENRIRPPFASRLRLRYRPRLQLFHAPHEPERGVRRVPIAGLVTVNDIRQRSLAFEGRERLKDLHCVVDLARSDHAAHEDERVPAPVEEPGIARNDGFQIVALDNKEIKGFAKCLAEGQP